MLGSAASLLVLRWQPLLMVFPPCFLDFNILGVDFLHHFQLTVDVTAKRLRHRLGHITATALGDSSLISSTTAPMAVPASGPAGVAGVKGPSPEGGWDCWGGSSPGSTRGGTSQHLHGCPERRWSPTTCHSWGGATHWVQRQTSHRQIPAVGQF